MDGWWGGAVSGDHIFWPSLPFWPLPLSPSSLWCALSLKLCPSHPHLPQPPSPSSRPGHLSLLATHGFDGPALFLLHTMQPKRHLALWRPFACPMLLYVHRHRTDSQGLQTPRTTVKLWSVDYSLLTLSLTINETLQRLSSLPILMQESYWRWQC